MSMCSHTTRLHHTVVRSSYPLCATFSTLCCACLNFSVITGYSFSLSRPLIIENSSDEVVDIIKELLKYCYNDVREIINKKKEDAITLIKNADKKTSKQITNNDELMFKLEGGNLHRKSSMRRTTVGGTDLRSSIRRQMMTN